jgi:RNA polymerase sigma-70 factor (ECF subfamily)
MFSTTQWTVVFRAAQEASGADRPAMNALLDKYWQPLYAFARQQGLSVSDAEDATQSFLSEMIQGDLLAKADPAQGRFRTYLLTAWKRFLIDQHRREHRLKRGGGIDITSIHVDRAEQYWNTIAHRQLQPDHLFHVSWALGLVDESIARVQGEYQSSHRIATFEALLPFLTQPVEAADYESIAARLGITPGAAKVALHRFRHRFASTLREVVRETLDDDSELESEIAEILSILAKK